MNSTIGVSFHLKNPRLFGYVSESLAEHGRNSPDAVALGLVTLVYTDSECYYTQGYGDDGNVVGYSLLPPKAFPGVQNIETDAKGPAVGSPAMFAAILAINGEPEISIGDAALVAKLISSDAFLETWSELSHYPRERAVVERFMREKVPVFARQNPGLFGTGRSTVFEPGSMSN